MLLATGVNRPSRGFVKPTQDLTPKKIERLPEPYKTGVQQTLFDLEKVKKAAYFHNSSFAQHSGWHPTLEGYILQGLSEAQAKAQQSQESWSSIERAESTLENQNRVPERNFTRLNSTSLIAQKGVNAVLLHEYGQAIGLIDRSLKSYNPTLTRGRARLLIQKAEALYGLGIINACTYHAEEALRLAQSVGANKTITRVRNLYSTLLQSPWRKEQSIAELGAALSTQNESSSQHH